MEYVLQVLPITIHVYDAFQRVAEYALLPTGSIKPSTQRCHILSVQSIDFLVLLHIYSSFGFNEYLNSLYKF